MNPLTVRSALLAARCRALILETESGGVVIDLGDLDGDNGLRSSGRLRDRTELRQAMRTQHCHGNSDGNNI